MKGASIKRIVEAICAAVNSAERGTEAILTDIASLFKELSRTARSLSHVEAHLSRRSSSENIRAEFEERRAYLGMRYIGQEVCGRGTSQWEF